MSESQSAAVTVQAPSSTGGMRSLFTSMRLHLLFLRFSGASLATGATDQVLFAIALRLGTSIAAGIVVARLLSSAVNLSINRRYVFRSHAGLAGTLLRYYACMALNGTAAYALIRVAHDRFHAPVIPAKVTVEIMLFVVSFVLSHYVIFRQRSDETR